MFTEWPSFTFEHLSSKMNNTVFYGEYIASSISVSVQILTKGSTAAKLTVYLNRFYIQ